LSVIGGTVRRLEGDTLKSGSVVTIEKHIVTI
jgi:hypothetical protein